LNFRLCEKDSNTKKEVAFYANPIKWVGLIDGIQKNLPVLKSLKN